MNRLGVAGGNAGGATRETPNSKTHIQKLSRDCPGDFVHAFLPPPHKKGMGQKTHKQFEVFEPCPLQQCMVLILPRHCCNFFESFRLQACFSEDAAWHLSWLATIARRCFAPLSGRNIQDHFESMFIDFRSFLWQN